MPGDAGVLVVTRVRSITTIAHEAAGATGARHSPRPQRGREINADLGRMARRGREGVFGEYECAAIFVERCDAQFRLRHSGMVRRTRPQMRNCASGNLEIPGSCFACPGMTVYGFTRGACHRAAFAPTAWLAMMMKRARHTHRLAQENVAATLPSPKSSITTLSPAVSQIVLTRLPVSTISPAERPLPSEAR
jgi:hypothetical protein